MKLIIGLGNPGEEYKNTRHNAGFFVAETLSAKIRNSKSQSPNKRVHHFVGKILIFKSKNFMNESGSFINELIHWYKVEAKNLYVIHDDLDIPLGKFKIQFGRGPKDHNGVLDIEDKLGTKDFWRVRIGIENRHSEITENISRVPMRGVKGSLIEGEKYVLQEFTEEERAILDRVIKKVASKLDNI